MLKEMMENVRIKVQKEHNEREEAEEGLLKLLESTVFKLNAK